MLSSARKQCCASIERPRPSNLRFSCRRNACASEFYGPLIAIGEQHAGGARGAPRLPAATAG